ncbi:MAG: hypothetical protein IJA17_08850 [Oscillospiraceae bacterium]|nr:hypothetical protein [Oscillospiraceae bacterium]
MGLFDVLKQQAKNAIKTNGNKIGKEIGDNIKNAVKTAANKSETVVFDEIPGTYEDFINLPEAKMKTPFDTAAMTVLAFCVYPENRELSIKMLNFLRGPRPLSGIDANFIRDRFMDGRDYVPRSYFKGATPENDYRVNPPYSVVVSENPYSYENKGYAKLFVRSGGADSLREIVLREAKDGKWYLWEQFILGDIRQPESADPWA